MQCLFLREYFGWFLRLSDSDLLWKIKRIYVKTYIVKVRFFNSLNKIKTGLTTDEINYLNILSMQVGTPSNLSLKLLNIGTQSYVISYFSLVYSLLCWRLLKFYGPFKTIASLRNVSSVWMNGRNTYCIRHAWKLFTLPFKIMILFYLHSACGTPNANLP